MDEYPFTAAATLNPGFIFPGCIYIEQKEGNYRYFYYPDEYGTGWQTFVEHMTATDRTFFDDSYRPDTSLPPDTPTFPPFEEPDTRSFYHTLNNGRLTTFQNKIYLDSKMHLKCIDEMCYDC